MRRRARLRRRRTAPTTTRATPRRSRSRRALGVVYSLNPKTVLRGGYGIYWAPWNYQAPSNANYGQIGCSQQTFINQGQFRPTVTLSNPFPGGVLQPVGNALGALTGVGGEISFIDQDKKAPLGAHVFGGHQSRAAAATWRSASSTRARPAAISGSAARTTALININQVRSAAPGARRAALNEPCRTRSSDCRRARASTSRARRSRAAQLLRPFPQFGEHPDAAEHAGQEPVPRRRSSSSRSA